MRHHALPGGADRDPDHDPGGAGDVGQFVARPTWGVHPWRTPVDGVWLCSASTPPGGGVHGMGGFHAANDLLAVRA